MVEILKSVIVPSFLTEKDLLNKNIKSIITILNEPKSIQELFNSSNKEDIVQKNPNTEKLPGKNIYVCTFCQVFSSFKSDITSHIVSLHKALLPSGTRVGDFVSQLQSLQNVDETKKRNKGGRPRKKESLTVVEEKAIVSEPILGPDGLYWCQKCHRHFKKLRQFSSHVCLEMAVENLSCESAADSDSTSDFQTYMDIEPTPWNRRPKHNNKSSESDLLKPEDAADNMKLYWRDDPNYVQLFENDAERYTFEQHLKSIDYSCIDSLFVKEQRKSKSFKKRNNPYITLYSCIICQKKFPSLSHIRMHCLTHTDLKPFTCPKCSYRSNTKGSLYTHMRNHTGKLFYCSKCAFKTIKRSHLLEHEQTHSSVMQLCKLCKNTYKTVKSLIAHVQKYHNNPGGKKYAKFLSGKSSKDSFIKCNICQKKFKTQTSFSTHVHTAVPTPERKDCSDKGIQNASSSINCSDERIQSTSATASHSYGDIENISTTINHSYESIQNNSPDVVNQEPQLSMPDNNIEYTNEIETLKNPLGVIGLNDLLQLKNSEIYQNMFQQSSNPHIQTESADLTNTFTAESLSKELSPLDVNNQFSTSNTVLEECEKKFGIDLIKECFKDSEFAEKVMAETGSQSFKLASDSKPFGIHEIQNTYSNETIISPSIAGSDNFVKSLSHIDDELNDTNDSADFVSSEPKSAETKLFEKCRKTAAYLCCVCSAIYVCPMTLKIHLQQHVNTNNSLIEQDNEDLMDEADATIDSVCQMLEDSDNERELEKLYNSSLDMMYYLPEVSVLLENDPKFNDAVLNDFSNFPISDKYDDSLSDKYDDIASEM